MDIKLTFAALVVLILSASQIQAVEYNTVSKHVGTTTMVVRKSAKAPSQSVTPDKNVAKMRLARPLKIKGYASTAQFVNFVLGFGPRESFETAQNNSIVLK